MSDLDRARSGQRPRPRPAFWIAVWVTLGVFCVLGVVGVGWLVIATVATTRHLEQQKVSRAQLACQEIARAADQYATAPANPGTTEEDRLPRSPEDLLSPPFGGPSFLRDGPDGLIDPWGKPYRIERKTRRDGSVYVLVSTTAPDGTPVSQFGFGAHASPDR